MHQFEIHGRCDARFEGVKKVFEQHLATGEDVGASFAVYKDGVPIVDIWGGFADAARTCPWNEDTIACVFSSTKAMAAICVHVLADRGLIDFEAPVARYWPEFARSGKERVLVKHVMSHSSGVVTYPEQVTPDDLADWEKMVGLIERQPALWEPGTRIGYQMTTHSFLIGELVRRVAGRSIGTFFKDEIAGPLGADFHIGTPESAFPRIAQLVPPDKSLVYALLNNDAVYTLFGRPITMAIARNPKIPIQRLKVLHHEPRWQQAELASSNGNGNARSMARIGAMVACGGELDGKRILSPDIIKKAATPQFHGKGYLFPPNTSIGLGWSINTAKMANGKVPLVIGWSGLGGSFCAMDLDNRMSYAFVMNKMNLSLLGDRRRARFEKAIYASLSRVNE
ncbi:MAG: beta-lactamase family protein [Candidatus Lokiarchaeota archaeon]|nr:beta-lactamase family protein [Candidatus Lokiarchaeota archaeon]